MQGHFAASAQPVMEITVCQEAVQSIFDCYLEMGNLISSLLLQGNVNVARVIHASCYSACEKLQRLGG